MQDASTTAAPRRSDATLAARLFLASCLAAAVAMPFVVLLLLVEGRSEALEALDTGVAADLHAWALRSSTAVAVLEALDLILHPMVFRALVLALCVVLWRRGAHRLALWAGVTMAAGSLLGLLAKAVVARARPTFDDPVTVAGGYSFPSGHALNSLLGCAVLLLALSPVLPGVRRLLACATGAGVVLLTGLDRVALGVHYVSDVVAGWSLALAVVAATTAAVGRSGLHRESN